MTEVPRAGWVAPRMPSTGPRLLPRGAWDTHAHVLGPPEAFPFVHPPSYPPPDAPAARHRAMLDAIGARYGVVVQPAAYSTDARAILDACRAGAGRVFGVAAADETIDDRTLADWASQGVRGLRFCEIPDPRGGGRFHGSVGFDTLTALAPRMAALGMHAVLWAPIAALAEFLPRAVGLGVPIVLDHIGSVVPARAADDPAWRLIVDLLREGQVWLKLVACRVSTAPPAYPDLRPLHEHLARTNPDRLLWGSDWPFVRMGDASPDVARLVALFLSWIQDDTVRRKILVDNPAALFGVRAATEAGPVAMGAAP